MSDFARAVDSTVHGALNPGERVIWSGHCLSRLGKQRAATSFATWGAMLPIPAIGIGIVLLLSTLPGGWDFRVVVAGVLLAGGGWLLRAFETGRFSDNAMYCRKQTAYVLTNQRAFVLKHCRTAAPMRSVAWRYVDQVRVTRAHPDLRGTVEFLRFDPMTHRWQVVLQFSTVGSAAAVADWARTAMAQAAD